MFWKSSLARLGLAWLGLLWLDLAALLLLLLYVTINLMMNKKRNKTKTKHLRPATTARNLTTVIRSLTRYAWPPRWLLTWPTHSLTHSHTHTCCDVTTPRNINTWSNYTWLWFHKLSLWTYWVLINVSLPVLLEMLLQVDMTGSNTTWNATFVATSELINVG